MHIFYYNPMVNLSISFSLIHLTYWNFLNAPNLFLTPSVIYVNVQYLFQFTQDWRASQLWNFV